MLRVQPAALAKLADAISDAKSELEKIAIDDGAPPCFSGRMTLGDADEAAVRLDRLGVDPAFGLGGAAPTSGAHVVAGGGVGARPAAD